MFIVLGVFLMVSDISGNVSDTVFLRRIFCVKRLCHLTLFIRTEKTEENLIENQKHLIILVEITEVAHIVEITELIKTNEEFL